jgi:hypothetical protein
MFSGIVFRIGEVMGKNMLGFATLNLELTSLPEA